MLISLRKWSLQVVLMQESSDNHSPPHFQNEFCHFWLVNTNTKAQFMDKKRRRRSLLLHQYRKIICLQSACCQHYDHKDSQSCVKTREQIFMVLPMQNKWGSTCERDRWWWKVLSQTLALATADWTEFEWGRQHAAVHVVQNLRNEDRSPADEIAVDSQERLQTFLQNLIYLQLYYRQGFQYRKQKIVLEVADVRNKIKILFEEKKKKVVHFQSFGIVCIPSLCEPTQINTKVS